MPASPHDARGQEYPIESKAMTPSLRSTHAVCRAAALSSISCGVLETRVVKKFGRALGASLIWSESTAAGHVVLGSSDLLRPIEDGANS